MMKVEMLKYLKSFPWKRFDLGIQYGIGLELNDRYLINLTGQNGFISPADGGENPKNMTFSIGVGYRF